MSAEEIIRDIRAGRFAPVYFMHGEEPFFIDQIADAVEAHALPEAERGFNQTILYGKDVDHLTLLDYLRRYPMMSERQVVILREAQDMKSLGELAGYLENPMPSTVFVACHKHKKVDARTKFGKALGGKGIVSFESKKLYDNQIPDWISSACKSKKLHIEPEAAALMAEYLGADLARISNELDKIALNLPPDARINTTVVQENIGISKEYNVFELQKALAARDALKVARIQKHFASNIRKNPLIVTISSLFAYFSKVFMLHSLKGRPDTEVLKALDLRSDWFLKDYKLAAGQFSMSQCATVIGHLRDYDLRSKGVENDGVEEEELMKELFWKILHA